MNNKEKMLETLLVSLTSSGLVEQFVRESNFFKLFTNSIDDIDFVLKRVNVDNKIWKSAMEKRRDLVFGLNPADFSAEINEVINSVNSQKLKEVMADNRDFILSRTDKKIMVSALEEMMIDSERSGIPVIEYNKDLILALAEKLLTVKKDSYGVDEDFRSHQILHAPWYVDFARKNGKLALSVNFEDATIIEDRELLKDAINQDLDSFDEMHDKFKNDREFVEIILSRLEDSLNNLMEDKNPSNQLNARQIQKAWKILKGYVDNNEKKNSENHDVVIELLPRLVSTGVMIPESLVNDSQIEEVLSVRESIYNKARENVSDKNRQQIGTKINEMIFPDGPIYENFTALAKQMDIIENVVIPANNTTRFERDDIPFLKNVAQTFKALGKKKKNAVFHDYYEANMDGVHLARFIKTDSNFTVDSMKQIIADTRPIMEDILMRSDLKKVKTEVVQSKVLKF